MHIFGVSKYVCVCVRAGMDFPDGETRVFDTSLDFSIGEIQTGAKHIDFSNGEIRILSHPITVSQCYVMDEDAAPEALEPAGSSPEGELTGKSCSSNSFWTKSAPFWANLVPDSDKLLHILGSSLAV